MDELEKLRKEIERLSQQIGKSLLEYSNGGEWSFKAGEQHICHILYNLIDSLQKEPVSEDLEEAAHEYADLRMSNYETAFFAFMSGANWQKEQMMKGAIELPLYLDGDFLTVDYDFTESGYKVGDNVKIIIIKED